MSDVLKKNGMTANLEFSEVHFRKRRALAADPKICSGCRTCELICSLGHEGFVDPERARIFIQSNPLKGSFIPMICRQCSDAPCYYACPESAIEIDQGMGIVTIRGDRCTGCRVCEKICLYHAIRFDPEKNSAIKCDFCNGDPQCVKWCPVNALGVVEFGKGVF
jgi:Fe-S-cluster-containing dehydrogenase component